MISFLYKESRNDCHCPVIRTIVFSFLFEVEALCYPHYLLGDQCASSLSLLECLLPMVHSWVFPWDCLSANNRGAYSPKVASLSCGCLYPMTEGWRVWEWALLSQYGTALKGPPRSRTSCEIRGSLYWNCTTGNFPFCFFLSWITDRSCSKSTQVSVRVQEADAKWELDIQASIGENACETERAEDARRCQRAFGLGCGPDTDGGTEEKK